MNMFKTSLYIRWKLFFTPAFIVSMALIPFFLFILLSRLSSLDQTKINVGLVYESNDLKQSFDATLEGYLADTIHFIPYDSEKDLKKAVADYEVDCGYVFTNSLHTNTKNAIVLYETETSTVSKVLNVLVAATVMQEQSGSLGYQVLKSYLTTEKADKIKKEILENAYQYTQNGPMMQIKYEVLQPNDTHKESPPQMDLNPVFYTLFGAVALFVSILNVDGILREKNTDVFQRIERAPKGLFFYYSSYFVAQVMMHFFYLLCSQWLLALLYPNSYSWVRVIAMNGLYSICIALFSFLLVQCLKKNTWIITLSIFLSLYMTIFSDVIIKMQEIIKVADPFKYASFLFYYQQGFDKGLIGIGGLLLWLVGLCVLNGLVLFFSHKKNQIL